MDCRFEGDTNNFHCGLSLINEDLCTLRLRENSRALRLVVYIQIIMYEDVDHRVTDNRPKM